MLSGAMSYHGGAKKCEVQQGCGKARRCAAKRCCGVTEYRIAQLCFGDARLDMVRQSEVLLWHCAAGSSLARVR